MKLIEAKQAKAFASTFFGDPVLRMAVNAVVDTCPGMDLVRCKDCKHYDPDGEFCRFWNGVRHEAHYCGEGERRDNGQA